MTNITFVIKDGTYTFVGKGHCCGGRRGKDLICAGASTAMYMLITNITLMNQQGCLKAEPIIDIKDLGDAYLECIPKDEYRFEVAHLFEIFRVGFDAMAKQFPKNLQVRLLQPEDKA